MDVSEDLGSPLPPIKTAPAAFANPNISSLNTTIHSTSSTSSTSSASYNKGATSGHVQSSRSPVRVRPPGTSAYVSTGGSFSGSGNCLLNFFHDGKNIYVDLTIFIRDSICIVCCCPTQHCTLLNRTPHYFLFLSDRRTPSHIYACGVSFGRVARCHSGRQPAQQSDTHCDATGSFESARRHSGKT